jgi:hypothetical protein
MPGVLGDLINGPLGDLLTVTQLATQTVGARTFRTVARSFAPAAAHVHPAV